MRGGRGVGGRQQCFRFDRGWGGARKGAGRKPVGRRSRVSHAARPEIDGRAPLHITLRLCDGLPMLRCTGNMEVFRQVMRECRVQEGFRVVEWSVQHNHIHMLCEAEGKEALSRGMRVINTRLAKRWNKLWQRRGPVFEEPYHVVELRSPTQVRHALVYVLQNARKHGAWRSDELDPFSTARVFGGWRDQEALACEEECPRAEARTWLLREGWKRGRGGRPRVTEAPRRFWSEPGGEGSGPESSRSSKSLSARARSPDFGA